jgi:hypothetical protein
MLEYPNLADSLLDFHLTHGSNLFLALPDKLAHITHVYRTLESTASPDTLTALAQSFYAPYLLVQLIDKPTFNAQEAKGFKLFERCLEYATNFDIEELSKKGEIEEKFVKFLKYIEMLASTDPKKAAGSKLIQMIFSIDKYKAYQNVSLQLFDQDSLIILPEEEGKKNDWHDYTRESQAIQSSDRVRPSMHMSFAGKQNGEFSFETFSMQVLKGNQQAAIETMRRFKFSDVLFFRVVP